MKQLLILFIAFVGSISGIAQNKVYITVDTLGTGNFKTVQEAINSVRDFKPGDAAEIFIKKGVYREKIVLPTNKCNIRLIGEDMNETVISYNDYAGLNNMGTFRSYTFFLAGNDIVVENLTVENTAGNVGQAVAMHVEGDRIIFRNCRFLGNQDTVYTGRAGSRQSFFNCYIEGTTDFIFGPSTVWFEKCTIHCKRNSYITAASTPQSIEYGYIFNNCDITVAEGVTSVYLGRPWRAYAMTLFMNTRMPKEINPSGWNNWNNAANEETARYQEYNNSGPGADISSRVKWSKQLTDEEAKKYELPIDTSFNLRQTYLKEKKNRPDIRPVEAALPKGIIAKEGLVYSTITDIPFGIRELHLNIYRPEGNKKLPALLMVHGGGWNSGNLTMQIPMAQQIATKGYVTVPVEYRLIPEALYPAAINDLKDAVRWLRANADKYGIDPEKIAVSGCSAGGQLANLLGMSNGMSKYEIIRCNFEISSDVQAVINVDGLSDFTVPETIERAHDARVNCKKLPVDMIWLGGSYEEQKKNWEDASPIRQVTKKSAPVCFINSSIPRFHAGRDEQIVKLNELGIYSEVHTLDNTPHPFWLLHPWFEPTVNIMVRFLDRILK